MELSGQERGYPGFGGIVGQRVPVRVLSHLLQAGRLPGTLLFSGPQGVGKLATALAVAKRLLCKTGEDSCDCIECRAIRMGSHPDVLVLSREKDIKVEEMRELVALTSLRTAGGHERVIIIDRAENISQAGANAALKALEEPGERVRFMLIADKPELLLPTVRSRSYQVRFGLLSRDAMREFARGTGANPDDPQISGALDYARNRPGTYLRMCHAPEYREAVENVTKWTKSVMGSKEKRPVEAALRWKGEYREIADLLATVERNAKLPRGGDIYEVNMFYSRQDYVVSPINWRIEEQVDKESRWNEGRKILLLARTIRHILSFEKADVRERALPAIQDFIRKMSLNCSFDISLERLYFAMSGSSS
jgi:hypothetical protein